MTDFGVWDYTSGDGNFVKYSDPFRRSVQIVCIKSENDEITDDNLCYVTSSELDGGRKIFRRIQIASVSGKYCLIAYNPILGKKGFLNLNTKASFIILTMQKTKVILK